jgi:hypothetical protein
VRTPLGRARIVYLAIWAVGTRPLIRSRRNRRSAAGVGGRAADFRHAPQVRAAAAKERVENSKEWYVALPRRAQAAALGLALGVTWLETAALAGTESVSQADLPGVLIGVAGALGMVRPCN